MRRKEREVSDIDNILKIMEKCTICNLGFNDGEYPYVVPVNFAYRRTPQAVELYFHGANEGKKIDLIKKEGKAAFTMHCGHRVVIGNTICGSTREYESVCGAGTVEILTDDKEKELGLRLIVSHLGDDRKDEFDASRFVRIAVYRLTVKQMCGKVSTRTTSVEAKQQAKSYSVEAGSPVKVG
jgi:nitroimidazol reductase NimA-like FMN-containing flavoprotein (pyridoxamine 5'-phosphate oxidase superfamily)